MVVQLAQHDLAISCLHHEHLTVALGEEAGPEEIEEDVSEKADCDFDRDDFADRAWLEDREDRDVDGSGKPENSRHSGMTICAYMPDGTSCQ